MPKTPKSQRQKVTAAVEKYGKSTFAHESASGKDLLFCKLCSCHVSCDDDARVAQHVRTKDHKRRIAGRDAMPINIAEGDDGATSSKKPALEQEPLPNMISEEALRKREQKQFNSKLCEALIGADIPLCKLDNKRFRSFLEQYTDWHVPDRATLRKY